MGAGSVSTVFRILLIFSKFMTRCFPRKGLSCFAQLSISAIWQVRLQSSPRSSRVHLVPHTGPGVPDIDRSHKNEHDAGMGRCWGGRRDRLGGLRAAGGAGAARRVLAPVGAWQAVGTMACTFLARLCTGACTSLPVDVSPALVYPFKWTNFQSFLTLEYL